MSLFPSARKNQPDLYNLRIIHNEIRSIEKEILDSRYIGLRSVVISDTEMTNSVVNNHINLDTSVTGTPSTPADISDGDILTINGIDTTFNNVASLADIISQINANFSTSIASDNTGNLQLTLSDGLNIVAENSVLTALGLNSTVDLANNLIRITSHGLQTGDQVTFTANAELPVPINAFPDSSYYVIRNDADTFKIATTKQNSLEGNALDITNNATDYFKVKKTTDAELYYQVWKGYKEDSVLKLRLDEVVRYFDNLKYIIYRETNPNTDTTFRWVIEW